MLLNPSEDNSLKAFTIPFRMRNFQESVRSSALPLTAATLAMTDGGGALTGALGWPRRAFSAIFMAARSSRDPITSEGAFPEAEEDPADAIATLLPALAETPKTEKGMKRRVKSSAAPVELLSAVAHLPCSAATGRITDAAEAGEAALADPEAAAPFAAAAPRASE